MLGATRVGGKRGRSLSPQWRVREQKAHWSHGLVQRTLLIAWTEHVHRDSAPQSLIYRVLSSS